MEFAELILTPKLDGVTLHAPFHDPVEATICITSHHLILSSRDAQFQEIWLLHQCIDSIEKRFNGPNGVTSGGALVLKCKDLRVVSLFIGNSDDLLNVYVSLERLSNIDDTALLYPFFYRPMYSILEDGHSLYRPNSEFAKLLASEAWRLSDVNRDYSVCPSYGAALVVPRCIDDDTLAASAAFREGGRFPMLSYRHENGAVLLRAGQPLLNNCGRRSRSDEKILNAVVGNDAKGYIVDTRSAAYVNQCKARGGGTEPDAHYPSWKRLHKNLDKISTGALLDSFGKFVEAINDTGSSSEKWLSRLESSNWLTHVQTVLNTACLVAQCLDQEGVSVLVHGTHGIDSTLLVTSVTQVILNPDCRTLRGLQALIEREWLQAGHPFQTRHTKSCFSSVRNRQNCQPTFLLFLDCIHQLHHQFPCSFEFTTQTLIYLFEHSYFSQFGTFLGNCEADRGRLDVAKKSTSLWSYLNRPGVLTSLLNPLYEPNRTTIWPSVAPVSLAFWNELYLRWIIDQRNARRAAVRVQNLIQYEKEQRSTVTRLRKQLLDLQHELTTVS